MLSKFFINLYYRQFPSGIPLRLLLVVPFVLQVFVVTSIVGFLSIKQGQDSVNNLVKKLQEEAGNHITDNLDNYLSLPPKVVEIASHPLEQGLLDPLDLKIAGTYFWKYSQVFPNISWIGYYLSDRTGAGAGRWYPNYRGIAITQHPGGKLRDYTYASNASGQMTRLLGVENYDSMTETWYEDTLKQGKASWGQIYVAGGYGDYIAVPFNRPIQIPGSSLQGILSLDLLLTDIGRFLNHLKISPATTITIVERDGRLVARSGNVPVIRKVKDQWQRVSLGEEEAPYYREMAQALQRQLGDLRKIHHSQRLEFDSNQEKQFVYIKPWQDDYGLDWLLIIAFPESDFLTEIYQNRRQTLLLCFMAALLAILVSLVTARLLSEPIQQFSCKAEAIAKGKLHTRIETPQGIRELMLLSNAFNEMARKLEYSFEKLEENVNRRTHQLNQAKELLENSNQKLTKSLQEKETLLKEVHHRVKNNLLIVASLLSWQEESLQDPAMLQILGDSQKRINSMALIHEKLYRSTDLTHIDFGDYLKTLTTQIFDSFCSDRYLIHLHYYLCSMSLNVQTATPCGLIVNELILNALEHAFPDHQSGNLFLTLKQTTNGTIMLQVQDDGQGLPADFNFRETESLGWQLICLLTEQLEGDIQVNSENGTQVTLTFRELQYRERF